MDPKTLDKIISSYLATKQNVYAFIWQGGEPTLMGEDFFESITDLQKKYGNQALIYNSVQTNGIIINRKMAEHFAEYKFLIGISIDGPEDLHDKYRKNKKDEGSHKSVAKSIDLLQKYNVPLNGMVLVNKYNVKKAKEVYRHLCELGITDHQYIPCVEFLTNYKPAPWTITPEEWGDFLIDIFNEWYPSDMNIVSVRNFDVILQFLVNDIVAICSMSNNCNSYFVVEYNGDVYPCDFFVNKELKLGNIFENEWHELYESRKYQEFGKEKRNFHAECKVCKYLPICAGDCLKYRINTKQSTEKISWLCKGSKKFYDKTLKYFVQISNEIKEKNKL